MNDMEKIHKANDEIGNAKDKFHQAIYKIVKKRYPYYLDWESEGMGVKEQKKSLDYFLMED